MVISLRASGRLIAIAALIVSGCATGERVRMSLHPGMTRPEVLRALGNPDGVQTEGTREVLTYANRLNSGWAWTRSNYIVVLDAGKVAQYGPQTAVMLPP